MKIRWMLVALLTVALLPTIAKAYPRSASSAALPSAALLQDHDGTVITIGNMISVSRDAAPDTGRASATASMMAGEIASKAASFTSARAGSIRIAATVLNSATGTSTNTSTGTATKTATRKATTDLDRRSPEEPSPDSVRAGASAVSYSPVSPANHYLFCHWPAQVK